MSGWTKGLQIHVKNLQKSTMEPDSSGWGGGGRGKLRRAPFSHMEKRSRRRKEEIRKFGSKKGEINYPKKSIAGLSNEKICLYSQAKKGELYVPGRKQKTRGGMKKIEGWKKIGITLKNYPTKLMMIEKRVCPGQTSQLARGGVRGFNRFFGE